MTLVLAGCSSTPPASNYVQPGAVEKAVLGGTWYYKTTVIDHPYEAKFTFIGEEGGSLEKIRWVIDEKTLYAYRAYETVLQTEPGNCVPAGSTTPDPSRPRCYQDGDCSAGQTCLKDPASYYGEPVAAWGIQSHFDIKRGYDPQSGAELNYYEENTRDRAWNLRAFMRIDWSANLIQDRFHFLKEYTDPSYASMKKVPAGTFDQRGVIVSSDYIDVTSREIVSATGSSIIEDPTLPLVDGSLNVTYRHSFLKTAASEYQALQYPDRMFDHFGYFRLDREGYDGTYGLSDLSRSLNICRWNIFKKLKDQSGNIIPAKDRDIRRVVFYMGQDFPDSMKEAAYAAVRDWDVAFRKAVSAVLQTDDINKMSEEEARAWVEHKTDRNASNGWGAFVLELRENAVCDELRQAGVKDSSGNRVLSDSTACAKGVGDLRYNMLNWISKPMSAAPIGYGPVNWDPETGEMIGAAVNVYGASLEQLRTLAMEMYDIAWEQSVNDEDITAAVAKGGDVLSYFRGIYGGIQPEGPGGGPWKPSDNALTAINSVVARAGGSDMEQGVRNLTDPSIMTAFQSRGAAFAGDHPEFERMLLGGELMAARGFDVSSWDPASLTAQQLAELSPLRRNAATATATYQRSAYLKSRFNCMLEQNPFMDLSVWKLVEKYKDRSRQEVADIVEAALLRGVVSHELGHAIGLRHEFAGSADYPNYQSGYWKKHGEVSKAHPGFDLFTIPDNIKSEDDYNAYLSEWSAFRGGMEDEGAGLYQYSSVMDYPYEWYSQGLAGVEEGVPAESSKNDFWGDETTGYPLSVGRYDIAAVKFGYGMVAERWNGAPDTSRGNRKDARYYLGGEACLKDADCRNTAAGQTCQWGVCKPLRMLGTRVWDGGERCSRDQECPGYNDGQKCQADTAYAPVCSEFYENTDRTKEDGNPVRYAFCSDERTSDLPFCSMWDSGGTSQEIVANMADGYSKNYLFNNFRRYRRNFGYGYDDNVYGRYFSTIGKQFQGMLYNYYYGQGMRSPSSYTKPGGIIDMYLASVAGLNFFNSVIGLPDFGSYVKSDSDRTFLRRDGEPGLPQTDCSVWWGGGRYYLNRWDAGYLGRVGRLNVIGSLSDKMLALDAISTRDWNVPPSNLRFMVNYYDIFHNEVLDIFTGLITDDYSRFAMLAEADPGTGVCTTSPHNVWYGGTGSLSSPMFQRDPAAVYAGKLFIDPGRSFYNQYYPIAYAFSRFPVYFDTGFFNYVKIWIKGEGAQFEPKDGITDCSNPDASCCEYVSYKNPITWRGLKVNESINTGTGTKTMQRSIGCAMIERANRLKQCWETYPSCPGGKSREEYAAMLDNAESTMNIMRMFMQDYSVGY
jgi:hypothetical protein